MKRESIFVNGSWVDKEDFEEGIREALEDRWYRGFIDCKDDHVHCYICLDAIGLETPAYYGEDRIHWICEYCYNHFIKKNDTV